MTAEHVLAGNEAARDRFWSRVNKTETCWEWTAGKTSKGYGSARIGGKHHYAHRLSHEAAKGTIPAGLHIDHLCRNRACVRPEHLEAVTNRENARRGAKPYGPLHATCKQGHDITVAANVYSNPEGHHGCRTCRKASKAAWAARAINNTA